VTAAEESVQAGRSEIVLASGRQGVLGSAGLLSPIGSSHGFFDSAGSNAETDRAGLRVPPVWPNRLILLALAGMFSARSAADELILAVPTFAQESEQWCWAATGQSVMEFLAPQLRPALCQCRQAEARAPGLRCCASAGTCAPSQPLDPACRDLGWPDFARHGFEFKTTCDPLPEPDWSGCSRPPLTWEQLTTELRAGRPVVRAYRSGPPEAPAPFGHSVVIFGFRTATDLRGTRRWILTFDPKSVCRAPCEEGMSESECCHGDARWVPYERGVPGGTSHWIDFFGIRKTLHPAVRNDGAVRSLRGGK
jgi:hypothetical protein